MSIKKLAYFVMFFGLLLGLKPTWAEESPLIPVTVQVNWHHQYQFAGFYAALAQGYYRDAGLDVTIQDWRPGINVVEEVARGRATFGTAYSSAVADFINGAPILGVMASFQYSPMVLLSKESINDLAQLSGKSVSHYNNLQILALLNRAELYLEQPVVIMPPTGDLNDFISNRVDLYGAYETNEPYQLNELDVDYHLLKPADFGVNSMEDIVIVAREFATQHPSAVGAFRQATIAGWHYAIENHSEIVDFILQNYPVVKSEQALLYEAHATTKYVRVGRIPVGSIDPSRILATAAEARDIGLINANQFDAFLPERFIFNPVGVLALTDEERQYLTNNPVISIGNDIDWPPFEYIDKQGNYTGMVADYFKLFEKRLGVRFEPVKEITWSEVLNNIQDGQIDLLSGATPTPERKAYLDFTQPFLTFPMVLAGTPDTFFINHYQELEDKTVAVVKDYWSHEYLRNNYPAIDLYLVDSVIEGLEAVVRGQADVYSGNLAVINYTMRKYGITNVQIVGQSDQRFELAIGVPKDNPVLLSIMQKALDQITLEEHNEIYSRWINLQVLTRLDQRQIIQIGFYSLLLALLLGGWILIYRMQKQQLRRFVSQIHELTYASLVDPLTYRATWASQRYCELTGYSEDELKQISLVDLTSLTYTEQEIADIVRLVMAGNAWTGELEGRTKYGQPYWVELTLSPQRNLLGRVNCVLATRINITDKKRLEALSIEDELTGLYNRRHLLGVFSSEIKRLSRHNQRICMAVFDIDYFKFINDSYGHQRGDEVLKTLAMLTKNSFNRADDLIFRLGGEEFLIMTANQSLAEFEAQLQRFREAVLAMKIENQATELGYLTISIGAGVWLANQVDEFKDVYRQLDEALYSAKHQGRNKLVMVASPYSSNN